jgi:hypothetical protein
MRIIQQSVGSVNGLSLGAYRLGQAYDVRALMADYLMAEGLAMLEMRSADGPRGFTAEDRRRFGVGSDEHRSGNTGQGKRPR